MINLIKILIISLLMYGTIIFAGAQLTYIYESQNINANILTINDALWWSLNATSIGDSDVYPITFEGRIVGVFLILFGYGLFTVNVATICSMLNKITTKIQKH